MNNIAISPYIGMYALQIQNVKRNMSKTADINILNKKEVDIQTNNANMEEKNIDEENNENENKIKNKSI
jgi:hypothetical protein